MAGYGHPSVGRMFLAQDDVNLRHSAVFERYERLLDASLTVRVKLQASNVSRLHPSSAYQNFYGDQVRDFSLTDREDFPDEWDSFLFGKFS